MGRRAFAATRRGKEAAAGGHAPAEEVVARDLQEVGVFTEFLRDGAVERQAAFVHATMPARDFHVSMIASLLLRYLW
jgi:hypothetical protein